LRLTPIPSAKAVVIPKGGKQNYPYWEMDNGECKGIHIEF